MRLLYLILLSVLSFTLQAQITTVFSNFEEDVPGQAPQISGGLGNTPSGLFGQSDDFEIALVSENVGMSTSAGRVLAVNVEETGAFRLVDFETGLNSGLPASGTVSVAFDFLASEQTAHDGFAFLRCYDESGESFADLGFFFSESGYVLNLLDYVPETGEFLGTTAPPFPQNQFESGTWNRIEAIIDLNNNTLSANIDGQDYGVVTGISRATGTGFAGVFLNWGSTYTGVCAIDNFRISIENQEDLPPMPEGLEELLIPNDQGGTVIRVPEGDFRSRGLNWETESNAQVYFDSIYQGFSAYRFVVNEDLDEADTRLFSSGIVPFKRNRTYEVSALIRTDFPRATWEINFGHYGATSEGVLSNGERLGGIPAITEGPDGWQRWTWRFTPHWDDRFAFFNPYIGLHEYGPGFNGNVQFELADLAYVELPAVPLTPFEPGEGVSFAGGGGDLVMSSQIQEDQSAGAEGYRLRSTGSTFFLSNIFVYDVSTFTLKQNLRANRNLLYSDDLRLENLILINDQPDSLVLVNDSLTMGYQSDGLLVISPHREMTLTFRSEIGGTFNRISGGDLIVQDDFGGYTMSVHTPKGTGLESNLRIVDPHPDFTSLDPYDLDTRTPTEAGFEIEVFIRPGERLFISAFPIREYDWEKSFDFNWLLSFIESEPVYTEPEIVTDWVLWNFNQRGWAMSFGERYVAREDVELEQHITGVENANDKWSAYFSQWFYYSRDGAEWANEIKRWRDEYQMTAIYCDGLAQDDWLEAYKAMRILRGEVFPGGDIIIHDSYPQSGVPAAGFKPFIHAYATATYMGETAVTTAGADWAWPRYVVNQFGKSNAIGFNKGDRWPGFEGVERYLTSLVWGGRGNRDVADFDQVYLPISQQLETLYEQYGDDEFFFDRYYHPEAQLLTGYTIGRAGMPWVEIENDGCEDDPCACNTQYTISSWTPGAVFRYAFDPDLLNENSPILDDNVISDAEFPNLGLWIAADHPDYEMSRPIVVPACIILSNKPQEEQLDFSISNIYPVPALDRVNIDIEVNNAGQVNARLYNAMGQKVRDAGFGFYPAGTSTLAFELDGVPPGTYWVQIELNGRLVLQRIQVG
ncbi:MAG: T9SS type A sorting domain-containing protein [Bacteroidota bacterium]